MNVITVSDSDADDDVQFLSSTAADRFGGESLCERANIARRFGNQVTTLEEANEDFIDHRQKREAERNGFQYENESIIQSYYDIKEDIINQLSSDSATDDEDDTDDILGETADSELKQKWTPKVLEPPPKANEQVDDNLDFGSALNWDESSTSCLCYNSIAADPSESVQRAFYFNRSFLERLQRLDCKNVKLELHLWPSIMKNASVAAIAGPKTGKSTSYLVPLMNWFDSQESKPTKDDTRIGAIVVCSSTRQTYVIAQLAKLWRDNRVPPMEQTIRIISLNTSNEKRQMSAILNGCDILISTPEPLLRALNSTLIDCTHTETLVIDEADICLSANKKAVMDIYMAYANMKKTLKRYIRNGVVINPMAFQTMIFAERWTPDVQWFIQEVQHMPNIVFGSYYELSVAVGVKCHVRVIDSEDDREDCIRSLITKVVQSNKSKSTTNRIAIVCRDALEINYLKRKLNIENGLKSIIVTHELPHFELQKRSEAWNRFGGVLYINEEAIKIVDSFRCYCVIHYKLPKNFDDFGDRFRLMRKVMKTYKNPMEIDAKKDRQLSTYIVLSPSDTDVGKVFEYLTRLRANIPDKLSALYKYDRRPVCHQFAAFGKCPFESLFCSERHQFVPSDQPFAHMPSNGQIKFVVSYVKTTNEFFFRLLASRNEAQASGQWNEVDVTYEDIRSQLNELKNKPFNTISHISTKQVYGISVRGEVLRVRLTQISAEEDLHSYEAYDPKDKREKIELYCIDFGHKFWTHMRELFELPDHLKKVPPFAHKAYLFGIRPLDNEIDWDFRSVQKFYELVDNYRVVELTAWVLKQVRGVFWLNRLHVAKRLDNTRLKVDANPIKSLIDNRYVAPNPYKLPKANTDFDRIVNVWHNHRLERSAFNSCLVDVSTYAVVSDFTAVDHFYLIKEDCVNRLRLLEDKWSNNFDGLEPLQEVMVGQYCFYLFKDDQYGESYLNRAKVTAVADDLVDLFLLDHGEFVRKANKKSLYRILDTHLKELPFQAIKVSLFGVKVVKPITYDTICELTRDDTDQYRMCIADKVSFADGVHVIRLFVADNPYETHFTSLSKLLVDGSYAEYIDGEEDNELELFVEKENPEKDEEESVEWLENLELEMANNLSMNCVRHYLPQLEDTPSGNDSEECAKPDEPQPSSSTSNCQHNTSEVNGQPKPVSKPVNESRASKTLRRLRAIEAKSQAKPSGDQSDGEEDDKPSRIRPQIQYKPGDYDYPYDPSLLMWFDPNDHLDDNCDFSDEDNVIEEEDMS